MYQLTNIQKEIFYYCQTVEHPAIFAAPRARKTYVVLKDLLFQNYFPALVCVPLNTLPGWRDDLKNIGVPQSDYQILTGTKQQKEKKFTKGKAFTLVNKEFFISMPDLHQRMNFQSIVLDESTCIKNPKSTITKFYMNTPELKKARRRYILTGTPMTNQLLDIYCQLQFLDPTIFNCKTYWDFRHKYFYQQYENHWELKPWKDYFFWKLLKQYCFFVTNSDVRKSIGKKDLIQNDYVYRFALKPKIQEIYKALKEDFLIKVDGKIKFGIQYVVQQLVYLRQLCSGFIIHDLEAKQYELVDLSKYKLLLDIIKTKLYNKKVIILCNFYNEIETITSIFDKQGITSYKIITGKSSFKKKDEAMNGFQHKDTQFIIANSTCAQFGLTLSNADIMIKFSSVLGNIKRNQVSMRGTDIYKDDSIEIIHLIVKGSIEEYFYKQSKKGISHQKMIEQMVKGVGF